MAKGNFNEDYYKEREKIIINIKYDPNLISIDEMKQIELKLNI